MAKIKLVGIRDLKKNLSSYIKEAKEGTRILITEHNRVVAEIRIPNIQFIDDSEGNIALNLLATKKKFVMPSSKKSVCQKSELKLAAGTAKEILAKDRGE